MREQKGRTFHKGPSWFVQFRDNVKQPDGTYKRVQVCKKLDVEYGGEYRTRASVKDFVEKILRPINSGTLNPESTQTVVEFVEKIYLPEYVEKNLRAASLKQYRDVWNNHLKPRMGRLTLRAFRTVHGETMLAKIAEQAKLGRSSLRHCKAFLSGCFKQAKRLGILDGINPIQDVSIPRVPEAEQDTYAYGLAEIKSMLAVLPEPAHTVVLTAAFTGLRKSELRGLTWGDFDGETLTVRRSVWNSTVAEPKTRRSRSPIPIVKQLADALDAYKRRADKLAQSDLPIFQAGNGQPLNLDNLARRVITPALSPCAVCKKREDEHKPEAHLFERDKSLPLWHGWHAFRRGLATNLYTLGVDGKTIQAILRHSTLALTMNIYVKSVSESQTTALDSLSEKFNLCNAKVQ
ncbi:MAG TPA: tyrosine-type recombinase/integrase [Candidatus Dormibacteraeota bacterium]|nr:tyrosine-type recombinase/integrase [Candidatus Dormibacteraeota bacterium]